MTCEHGLKATAFGAAMITTAFEPFRGVGAQPTGELADGRWRFAFQARVSGIVLPKKEDCCRVSPGARCGTKMIFRKHGYDSKTFVTNAALGIFE
jgi:hypothetical protein